MDFPHLSKTTAAYRKRFLNMLGLKSFNDWSLLENVDEVISGLSELPTTRKTQYFHIVGYLKLIPEASELLREYLALKDRIIKKAEDLVETNTLETDTRADRYLSSAFLKEKLREMPLSKDKVLLAMYILEPPQRNVYHDMNIVKKRSDVDPTKNNLIVTSRSIRVYIPNHKTSKQYGPIDYAVSKETADLIRAVGFPSYGSDYIKKRIQSLSKKVFGQPIGIDSYRHIWEIETQASPEYQKMTIKQKRAVHESIGHSMQTALLYNRI